MVGTWGWWDLHVANLVASRPVLLLFSLAKKAKAIDKLKPVPLQPMNLMLEIKYTLVNKIDLEMEN